MEDGELEVLRKTNFNDVRDQVCKQGRVYNELISPFGKSLLKDSQDFFTRHIKDYSNDIESMKTQIVQICDKSKIFVLAYDMCNKLHSPLLTEAYLSKKMIQAAHEEITCRNEEYKIENNKLQLQLSDIQTKYKKNKETSNFWILLPIAGWSYMLIQKKNRNRLESEQNNLAEERDHKMRGIKQASAALYHLDVFLSPVLETYTKKIQELHDIFTDFHKNSKSFRDKLNKFENRAISNEEKSK